MSRRSRSNAGQARHPADREALPSLRARNGMSAGTEPFGLLHLFLIVAQALLLARWLLPTEAAHTGFTLGFVVTSGLVLAAVCWLRFREGLSLAFKPIDFAVWGLVLVHMVAAMAVVVGTGQKRAALNMLWEWFGIGVQFTLLRFALDHVRRASFLRAVMALGIALAGFGIWQFAVWYPDNVAQYDELNSRLNALENSDGQDGLTLEERRLELRQVRSEFVRQGIPLDRMSRMQFESRLRESTEPFGFFALANTFAGLIGVVAVLLCGLMTSGLMVSRRVADARGVVQLVRPAEAVLRWTGLGLLIFCLVLTKGRTAWCGVLAGIVTALILQWLNAGAGRSARRGVLWAAVFLAGSGILAVLGIAVGSLDREVISEASKSLLYRYEYWNGTWQIVQEHPWLGIGPGNFREHYLHFKLPGASEEVTDPHNLFLDVLVNAGLPGLIALLSLLWLAVGRIWQSAGGFNPDVVSQAAAAERQTVTDSSVPTTDNAEESLEATAVLVACAEDAVVISTGNDRDQTAIVSQAMGVIAVASILAVAGQWLVDAYLDLRIPAVGILAIVLCRLPVVPRGDLRPSFGGCTVMLVVHLLGAGGIAMPAVIGLLLALVAILFVDAPVATSVDAAADDDEPSRLPLLGVAGILAATVVCIQSGLLPTLMARWYMQGGDYVYSADGNRRQAEARYSDAAAADVYSPEPWLKLSELAFHAWEVSGDPADFDRSVELGREAISRSPENAHLQWQLGQKIRIRATREQSAELAATASEVLGQATGNYPHDAMLNADYAFALELAGRVEDAAHIADYALHLDQLNVDAGHFDRCLTDDARAELRTIVGAADARKQSR